MLILKIILLAIVQGLAELLPVSSSAHVIVAEKLMGIDPTTPQMTLLLVMLHTGTMFAVIVYFWKRWAHSYFRSADAFKSIFIRITLATLLTGVVGYPIKKIIEKTMFHGAGKAEIEQLFGRLDLIAVALFLAGILILIAGLVRRRGAVTASDPAAHFELRSQGGTDLTLNQSAAIGLVQGLCLPFRGFSRSGATISIGMLTGVAREAAETFSFALAVVLTPAVVAYEALRLVKASHLADAAGLPFDLHGSVLLSLLGAVFSFLAGLVALKWLSAWLESGKWYLFGIYCLVASAVILFLYTRGF